MRYSSTESPRILAWVAILAAVSGLTSSRIALICCAPLVWLMLFNASIKESYRQWLNGKPILT